jgi:hypothetical protein
VNIKLQRSLAILALLVIFMLLVSSSPIFALGIVFGYSTWRMFHEIIFFFFPLTDEEIKEQEEKKKEKQDIDKEE